MAVALSASAFASSVATASPATITSLQCTLDGNATFDASIGYKDTDTGRHYDYAMRIEGQTGSTELRDGAGRVVASALASTTARPVITLGAGYTSQVEATLVAALGDPQVQGELKSCAAPAAKHPGYHPWGPWYCPVLIFVWDPDLIAHLCGFPPVDPH